MTPFTTTIRTAQVTNAWWIEVEVRGSNTVVAVDAVVGEVATPLEKKPWGGWAKSFHVPPGTEVHFVARDALGQEVRSDQVAWPARGASLNGAPLDTAR